MAKWKGVLQDWNTVQEFENTVSQLACLTQRDQNVIIQALTPLRWSTRWTNLPDETALDYIDQLIGKIMSVGDCCNDILACVGSAEGTTIINNITNNYYGGDPNAPLASDQLNELACDPDKIFGAVTAITDYLNSTAVDTFELIEVATNAVELLADWVEDVPLITSTIIGNLISMLNWIQDSIAENYLAQYNPAVRDRIRCDLLCLWRESPDCTLTLTDMAQYFAAKVALNYTEFNDIPDLINAILDGDYSGIEFVDIMNFAICGLMSVGDLRIPFVTIKSVYTFDHVAKAGALSPNAEWSVLCDPCTVSICQDYFGGDGNLVNPVVPVAFAGVSGYSDCTATINTMLDRVDGCLNGQIGGTGDYVSSAMVEWELPVTWDRVTSVKLAYSNSDMPPSSLARGAILYYDGGNNLIGQVQSNQNDGILITTAVPEETRYIRVYCRAKLATPPLAYIVGLTVCGQLII